MLYAGASSRVAFLQYAACYLPCSPCVRRSIWTKYLVEGNCVRSFTKYGHSVHCLLTLCTKNLTSCEEKESSVYKKGLPYHCALAPCGEGGPPNAFPHQFPENPWVIIVNSADWLSTHAIFGQNWPSCRIINFEGKKGGPFLRKYTSIEMLSARIWHGRVSGVTIHNISNVIISSVFHGHCTITIK